MQPQQWERFRPLLQPDRLVRLSPRELARRASATQGYALTPEQYGELAVLDGNVLLTPEGQFGAGWTRSGFKLFRLAHPLPQGALSTSPGRICAA